MKIFSKNEYGQLRSVIVGRPENARWPEGDHFFDRLLETFPNKLDCGRGPLPTRNLEEAKEDVYLLIDLLRENKVDVYRPDIMDWNKKVSSLDHKEVTGMNGFRARDILLTVGDTAIECPTPFLSRQHEIRSYHVIKNEAISDGAKWISAPKALMEPAECIVKHGMMYLTERYPIFEGGSILKFDDKLLYCICATANKTGAKWLQKVLGNEVEVITWHQPRGHFRLDENIVVLNSNTILLNSDRITDDMLPSFLKDYNKIYFKDIRETRFSRFAYADRWVGINILCLNPETLIVDSAQTKLIQALKDTRKFKILPLHLRHHRTLGGNHHSITCDLERT